MDNATRYVATRADGTPVFPGDTVTDFRGDTGVFLSVTRGPEYNGTAKVLVRKGTWERESYANVYDLTVTPSA